MLPTILKALLYSHIAGGAVALLTGAVSLLTIKGGRAHKRVGLVFFYAMLLVAVSAFAISVVKGKGFLLAISIFSFYLTYTGYRVLKNKTAKYAWYDWLVTAIAVACACYMLCTKAIVLLAFGFLLLFIIARNTYAQFQGEEKLKELRKKRISAHLGNMSGAYIATVTAFLVVNVDFIQPGWLVWLFPSVIGVPFILYQVRKRNAAIAA